MYGFVSDLTTPSAGSTQGHTAAGRVFSPSHTLILRLTVGLGVGLADSPLILRISAGTPPPPPEGAEGGAVALFGGWVACGAVSLLRTTAQGPSFAPGVLLSLGHVGGRRCPPRPHPLFVCFLIRSHPPPPLGIWVGGSAGLDGAMGGWVGQPNYREGQFAPPPPPPPPRVCR